MAKSTLITAKVDVRDFRAFAKDLRAAEPVLFKGLLVKLRVVADEVAGAARANLSGASTTIPPSIKVHASGSSISIVAGVAGSPLAGLLELGNVGSRSATTFRHPVFGHNTWVAQPMHPYLGPAIKAAAPAIDAAMVNTWDEAVRVMRGI